MAGQVQTIIDGMSFTECPRWHQDRLWFVDFYTEKVLSAHVDGSDLQVEAEVEGRPSGLGWLPDGRMLVVSQLQRKVLRQEPDGSLSVHADLSELVSSQLNDMVVDAQGRAWVGNFGFDLMSGATLSPTAIHRIDPDGSVCVAAQDMWFPNGSVITPEGRLLVNETFGNRVSSFAIAADGSLRDRQEFAVFGTRPGAGPIQQAMGQVVVAPDGSALDHEGSLWIADAVGQRAIKVVEGGEIVESVEAGTGVFACGLGGSDGSTLFLCAAPDFLEVNRTKALEAQILAVHL